MQAALIVLGVVFIISGTVIVAIWLFKNQKFKMKIHIGSEKHRLTMEPSARVCRRKRQRSAYRE